MPTFTRRSLLTRAAALALPALPLTACSAAEPTALHRTLRYRFTVEVATPEGIKTGSSVHEVQLWFPTDAAWGVNHRASFRGEATVVDLGSRGKLFVLLNEDGTRKESREEYQMALISHLQSIGKDWGQNSAKTVDAFNEYKGRIAVPLSLLPLCVRFADPADPATVAPVDPAHLEASFGAGVRLAAASIEVASDPLSTGIEKSAPWLLGPFTWLKPIGNSLAMDTRTAEFKVSPENFWQGK